MKLVIFIIILSSFQAIAFDASSQQRINLDVKNLSIPQIIEKIENDYKYRFVYNSELKSSNLKLDLYAKNATLDYVMQNMLKATAFSYKKINKGLVVIIGKPGEKFSIVIEGKVTNPAGDPLSGVSVVEKERTMAYQLRKTGVIASL
ncbi:STN domain-containing protein [Niabella sp. W65]|nr:STN domain-containing protein [Niabella sp. W65]MCH7365628.1 STN domain-containing protein [Niabella sp. W65]